MFTRNKIIRNTGALFTCLVIIFTLYRSAPARAADEKSGNLLTNPGAETGSLTGWTMNPSGSQDWFNAGITTGRGYPAARTGSWYFTPGDSSSGELYQDVDISGFASGTVTFSGWLSDYTDNHGDESSLRLELLNASGSVLSSSASGVVTKTSWTNKSITLPIISDAVKARAVLVAKRNSGAACDSYFDDLSLVCTKNTATTDTSAQNPSKTDTTSNNDTSGSSKTKKGYPIGYRFKDDKGRIYSVINDKTLKVSLVKVPDIFINLSVAETVTAPNGTKYRITCVGKNAAKGCKNLEIVWFSKNLTRIQQYAFKNCKKLKAIYFFNKKFNTKYIDITGFYGIQKKARIYVCANKVKGAKKFFKKNKKTKYFGIKSVPKKYASYLGNAY